MHQFSITDLQQWNPKGANVCHNIRCRHLNSDTILFLRNNYICFFNYNE